jgi:hypothetical protein
VKHTSIAIASVILLTACGGGETQNNQAADQNTASSPKTETTGAPAATEGRGMQASQSFTRAGGTWEGESYRVKDRKMVFAYKLSGKDISQEFVKWYKISIGELMGLGVAHSESTKNEKFNIIDLNGNTHTVDLTKRKSGVGVVFFQDGKEPLIVDEAASAEDIAAKARNYYTK